MALGKILIVDDEPLMCNSLQALLGRDGYEAKGTTTAKDALHCFACEAFDVVLLDMQMPEMSGLELMDYIKERNPETLFVVITGQASEDSIVASLRKGAFDYLRKPFEHEELLKTVKNAMRQKQLAEKRKQAEQGLQRAHEDLERRVEERTAELEKTNAQLMREIEERKWAEQELQAMNEEVRNFAHAVSHDLKNPLMSIQGFSHRLANHFSEVLGEKGMGYIQHIIFSAHRMELLVSDLLTLSTIGQVRLNCRQVSCKEIVEDVISSLDDRLKEKCVTTVVADHFPAVFCDGERLYQIFENLIMNAIKFLGDVSEPTIEVGYEDQGPYHGFYVKDNGIGIEAKYHHKIFEKFCRLHDIESEEGTGLGLPIVQRILEKFDGKVWVVSKKGKGAAFHFMVPKVLKDEDDEKVPGDRCGEKTSDAA